MTSQPHALLLRAREALTRGDLAAALQAADARLLVAPRDVEALQVRYSAHQRRGEIAQAANALQAIIKIDLTADWAFNDLVRLLFQHGHRPEAEQVARMFQVRINEIEKRTKLDFGRLRTVDTFRQGTTPLEAAERAPVELESFEQIQL